MTLVEIKTVPICAETSSIIVEDLPATSVGAEPSGRHTSGKPTRGTNGCSPQTPE